MASAGRKARRRDSAHAKRTELNILPHFEGSFQLARGSRDQGLNLRHDAFQMLEGLINGQGIHFAA